MDMKIRIMSFNVKHCLNYKMGKIRDFLDFGDVKLQQEFFYTFDFTLQLLFHTKKNEADASFFFKY